MAFAQYAGGQVVPVLEDGQQQVLGVHRIALQQACLEYADFQDARGDGGQGDVRIGRQALVGLYLEVVFYTVFQSGGVHIQAPQDFAGLALPVAQEAQQKVLGAYATAPEAVGLLLAVGDNV